MSRLVRGELDALPEWETAPATAVDAYKLFVWVAAITTPWLAIVTVALVSVRALG